MYYAHRLRLIELDNAIALAFEFNKLMIVAMAMHLAIYLKLRILQSDVTFGQV